MDLKEISSRAKEEWNKLHKKNLILISGGTCGRSAGALEILKAFEEELREHRLDGNIIETGCLGLCYAEPIAIIFKPPSPGICYGRLSPQITKELVAGHLINGQPLPDYTLGTIGVPTSIFKLQVRRILGRCGFIDPENINHYLANQGYRGLLKAFEIGPGAIIEELKKAGLRGRGGAGFPTWKKWQFCLEVKSPEKYIICNADEGDPGAFMNRALLEGDPHSVLEGMLIAGYTIGSHNGYIYCRAEYPLALERIRKALKQLEGLGLIGKNILGSGFDFHIDIMEGAGAFVCGEETAIMASIEGRCGRPRTRPPFPATSGLWGSPTIINNVETLASVALILQHGSSWFAQYGTVKSKGTKTFSLVGKVKRTGLVEVPFGITLKQIIYEIGDGIYGNRKFKAVQTGGPSGGCIPETLLDLPVDYESITSAGSIMGSGGMVVMDEDTCMVDVARYFLDFTQKESCGKCVPCRVGTKQMLKILEDITEGRGRPGDIELLREMGETVKIASLCGLGQTAPNPVLTTTRYFQHEYEEHIQEKFCRATTCQHLFYAPCINECPCEVDVPAYVSFIGERRYPEALKVHLDRNPFPSICARVCPHPCEVKCRRQDIDEAVAIRILKRFFVEETQDLEYLPEVMRRPSEESKKIAIVGGGPAGLSASYFLGRLGHKVTIFEAREKLGGMLRYGIPEYRLPKTILDKEIERIIRMGIEVKLSMKVGRDIALDELDSRFEAVFIGIGAWEEKRLNINIPKEGVKIFVYGLEFLQGVATGKWNKLKGKVIVVGGGNTAIDAARTALRLGADKVTILYRRTANEMPALPEEIEQAREENIQMEFLVALKEITFFSDKKRFILKCQKMILGDFDETGRRRPVSAKNGEFSLEADLVIAAIGQGPGVESNWNLKLSPHKTIEVNSYSLETSIPGIFAGGDVVLGPANVVRAIAHGQRAAEAIERRLNKEKIEIPWRKRKIPDTFFDPEAEPLPFKRVKTPLLAGTAISEEDAAAEAGRCLRCDYGKQLNFK